MIKTWSETIDRPQPAQGREGRSDVVRTGPSFTDEEEDVKNGLPCWVPQSPDDLLDLLFCGSSLRKGMCCCLRDQSSASHYKTINWMLYDVLRVIFVSVRPQLCTAEREAGLGPVGRFLGSSLPDLNPDFSALDTLKSLGSAPALFILNRWCPLCLALQSLVQLLHGSVGNSQASQ